MPELADQGLVHREKDPLNEQAQETGDIRRVQGALIQVGKHLPMTRYTKY